MLVISELEKELQAASDADPVLREIKEQMRVKENLELNLDEIRNNRQKKKIRRISGRTKSKSEKRYRRSMPE